MEKQEGENFSEKMAGEQRHIDGERGKKLTWFEEQPGTYKILHPSVRNEIIELHRHLSDELKKKIESNIHLIQDEALNESKERYQQAAGEHRRVINKIKRPGTIEGTPKMVERQKTFAQEFKTGWGVPLDDPTVTTGQHIDWAISYGVLKGDNIPTPFQGMGEMEGKFHLIGPLALGSLGLAWTAQELDSKIIDAAEEQLTDVEGKIEKIDEQLTK